MHNTTDTRPTWGRVRFGSTPRISALAFALPTGLVTASALALLTAYVSPRYEVWWQSALIYLIMLTTVSVGGIWTLVIDRSTLRGAVRNPEASVEQSWAKTATLNAFIATAILTSIALTVAVVAEYHTVANTLLAVLITQLLTFVASYLIETRRK